MFPLVRRSIGSCQPSAHHLLSLTYCWTLAFLGFSLHVYKTRGSYAETPCRPESWMNTGECCKDQVPTTSLSLQRHSGKTWGQFCSEQADQDCPTECSHCCWVCILREQAVNQQVVLEHLCSFPHFEDFSSAPCSCLIFCFSILKASF